MATKPYVGVNGKARLIKKMYIGVNGKARKITKAYVGVNGKARLYYTNQVITDTNFSSNIAPTSWSVSSSTSRKATASNSYGSWTVESSKAVGSTHNLPKCVDDNTSTYMAITSTKTYVDITLTPPTNIYIKPTQTRYKVYATSACRTYGVNDSGTSTQIHSKTTTLTGSINIDGTYNISSEYQLFYKKIIWRSNARTDGTPYISDNYLFNIPKGTVRKITYL